MGSGVGLKDAGQYIPLEKQGSSTTTISRRNLEAFVSRQVRRWAEDAGITARETLIGLSDKIVLAAVHFRLIFAHRKNWLKKARGNRHLSSRIAEKAHFLPSLDHSDERTKSSIRLISICSIPSILSNNPSKTSSSRR